MLHVIEIPGNIKNCIENDIEIEIDGIKLSSEDHVKLLGVNLEISKFIFNKFVLKPEIT